MFVKMHHRSISIGIQVSKQLVNVMMAIVLINGGILQAVLSQHAAALTHTVTQQFTQPCGNAGTPTAVHHVIWIAMENETYNKVIGNISQAPYQNQLASQCGTPTNMYNESHGSLINYMSATNGQDIHTNSQYVTHNDCAPNTTFCYSTTPSIFSQVADAGQSWRNYAEDMPSNCYKSDTGNYAVRHAPAAYYSTLTNCSLYDVPMGNLATQTGAFYNDLQTGSLPNFSFVSPNLINDAHSSSTQAGDSWLSQIVPLITSSANYQAGDTSIFITNDEGGGGTSDHVIGEDCANQALAATQPSCHIPTIVVSPYTAAGVQPGTFYTHYSMLRTTEELLGLPFLGQAATATSMASAFNLGTPTTTPPATLQPVSNLAANPLSSSQINVSWSASAGASSYAVMRGGTQIGSTTATNFNDSGLSASTAYSYSIIASDTTGATATSNTVTATTFAAAASTVQWIGNQSIESGITGWSGLYNTTSKSSQGIGGYDGSYSLRSTNSGSVNGSNGFVDKPTWLDGSVGKATVAGTTYTGSVWVKADTPGQKLTLFLRELNSAGAAMNKVPYNIGVTVTATDTNWFNITETYPAQASGDNIKFYVYDSNVAAGQGFNADMMSLTSPGSGTSADSTPPSQVGSFTAIPNDQTNINLSWTAATDNVSVTGYTILRNGTQIGTTTGTSYSDTGLSPNTIYNYSVVAADAAGNTSTTTTSATTPPVLGTPTALQATTPSTTEVDLTWTGAAGAGSYAIQRNGTTIGNTTTTSYADMSVVAGTSYSYAIVATDAYSGATTSSTIQVTTPSGAVTPPPTTLSLCGNAAPATPIGIKHIIVVMLENNSYKQVVGSTNAPYQTSLSTSCGVGKAMFGATHTSAANYLATAAGEFPASSPVGCGSVKACADASDNIFHQLDTASLGWRSYQESMPTPCATTSSGAYKIGHNPAIFYSNIPAAECKSNDLPVADLTAQSGAFYSDLQNQTLPSFSWVTPNLNNDGEGGLAAADNWTKNFLSTVQQSNSYQSGNTAVLITYDEGTGSDNKTGEDCTNQALDMPITNNTSAHQDSCHVPFFVVYPYTPAGTADSTFFDHYSITKTIEDEFGLPYLAHAGDAQTSSLLGHFGLH